MLHSVKYLNLAFQWAPRQIYNFSYFWPPPQTHLFITQATQQLLLPPLNSFSLEPLLTAAMRLAFSFFISSSCSLTSSSNFFFFSSPEVLSLLQQLPQLPSLPQPFPYHRQPSCCGPSSQSSACQQRWGQGEMVMFYSARTMVFHETNILCTGQAIHFAQ